ncbi:MAG: AI-2E family transporter [Candidatus Hydrogenedentes bacterium]|nr:AI-2E family transporter [Candidatus Hydrogenedentota bacterium]
MLQPVLSNPWVRAAGVALALALVVFLIYILTPVLVPLFLAFLVAYVFDPVVDYFEARRISRGTTIAGLAMVGLIAFLSVPLIVIPSIAHQAEGLRKSAGRTVAGSEWLDHVLEKLPIEHMAAELEKNGVSGPVTAEAEEEPGENVTELEPETSLPSGSESGPVSEMETAQDAKTAPETQEAESAETGLPEPAGDVNAREVVATYIAMKVRESALQVIRNNFGAFASFGKQAGVNLYSAFAAIGNGVLYVVLFVANFALFAFVAGYLLRDFDGLVAGAGKLIPPKYLPKVTSIMSQIDAQLKSFLRGQITVCCCLGAMYLLGFLIARTPFAILIAVFGTVASFIPFLGVTMVAIIAVLLTVLQWGLDWHVVVVLATIGIAQALEGNVLTPKIVGDQVGLNPVWVILAILVFGNFLGFLGLLLAVPIAAALKVLVLEGVAYYRNSPVFARPGDGPS